MTSELESTPKLKSEKTGQKCTSCGHPELSSDRPLCNVCKNFKARFKFTLTPEDRAFLNAHPYCGICGTTKDLKVDHDHETNVIRGNLCNACNTSLGRLGDNLAGLQRAIDYLNNAVQKETRN